MQKFLFSLFACTSNLDPDKMVPESICVEIAPKSVAWAYEINPVMAFDPRFWEKGFCEKINILWVVAR